LAVRDIVIQSEVGVKYGLSLPQDFPHTPASGQNGIGVAGRRKAGRLGSVSSLSIVGEARDFFKLDSSKKLAKSEYPMSVRIDSG
jgi:hypothetical protein